MNEPLTKHELQHIESLLNTSACCDVCASARVKVENMIAEYPTITQETIGEHTVTREVMRK